MENLYTLKLLYIGPIHSGLSQRNLILDIQCLWATYAMHKCLNVVLAEVQSIVLKARDAQE